MLGTRVPWTKLKKFLPRMLLVNVLKPTNPVQDIAAIVDILSPLESWSLDCGVTVVICTAYPYLLIESHLSFKHVYIVHQYFSNIITSILCISLHSNTLYFLSGQTILIDYSA